MSVKLKSWELARGAVFRLGFNLEYHTKAVRVRELITKLRPQDCDKELIRIGSNTDGGYLVPDDLDGIEYCFSPGVSSVSDFENHLAERNVKSFLADYSVVSPPFMRPEFVFDRKFIGAADCGHFMTLSSWKDKYLKGYRQDLLLQMDIEGFEYQVIMSTPDHLLDQFRIMVIEFHFLDRLFDPVMFELLSASFNKLLQFFHVAHIHPNNSSGCVKKGQIEIPRVMEFTFLNRKRVMRTTPQVRFPHRLDVSNTSKKALPLPECWYTDELCEMT